MVEVLGQIDRRHAASPELAIDAVSVGKGGRQPLEVRGHFFTVRASRSASWAFQLCTTNSRGSLLVDLSSTRC